MVIIWSRLCKTAQGTQQLSPFRPAPIRFQRAFPNSHALLTSSAPRIKLAALNRPKYDSAVPVIELQLEINAPQQRVFDLARSIDLHSCSVGNTDEQAISGVTSGLIGPSEEVTWSARHPAVSEFVSSRPA